MKHLRKILLFLPIIFVTLVYWSVYTFDYQVSKVVRFNDTSDATVSKVFDLSSYYAPAEKVFVKYYQSRNINEHDCNLLSKYSEKLLKSNSRSSQAYFVKAVCDEKIGNLKGALGNAYLALKYDKYNTTYLLTIAILQLNSGNLIEAEKFVNLIEEIDANTKNLDLVKNALQANK